MASKNAVMTIQNYLRIVDLLPSAPNVDLKNIPHNIIRHIGMGISLHSSHLEVLHCFSVFHHSTQHEVCKKPPAQVNDFQDMGHS